MNRVAAKIAATDAATPAVAVSSGMPAANAEPKVMTRTMSATRTPMPSLMVTAGGVGMKSDPPTSARRPCWVDAVVIATIGARMASVTSTEAVSYTHLDVYKRQR